MKKIKKNLIRFVLFCFSAIYSGDFSSAYNARNHVAHNFSSHLPISFRVSYHNDLQCVRFYGKSCNITLDIFRVCKELFSLYNAVRLITAFSHWTLSIWTLNVCQTLDFEFALPLHSVNLTCAKHWLQYKWLLIKVEFVRKLPYTEPTVVGKTCKWWQFLMKFGFCWY